MKAAVLFVSPHAEDANCLSQMLSPLPLVFDHVPDFQHARAKLGKSGYPVILTAAGLPDGSWLDVISLARDVAPSTEVIVTDRHADARFWAEVLNLGGYDLLVQPFQESEVRRILSNACSRIVPEQKGRAAL
jgi:DNA-binding NtrC family response regulator